MVALELLCWIILSPPSSICQFDFAPPLAFSYVNSLKVFRSNFSDSVPTVRLCSLVGSEMIFRPPFLSKFSEVNFLVDVLRDPPENSVLEHANVEKLSLRICSISYYPLFEYPCKIFSECTLRDLSKYEYCF